MTSGIITANIPIDVVNSSGETLYAGLRGILTGQVSDSDLGLTVTWKISQAPCFALGQDDTDQHNPQIEATIDFDLTTQPGNGSGKATANTVFTVDAEIADDYSNVGFGFYISGTTFDSSDPFLKAALQANTQLIEAVINQALAACGPLVLGPVGDLQVAAEHAFFSYAPPALSETVYTFVDDAGTVPSLDALTAAGKVSIGCDSALAQKVLDAIWWPTATRHWGEGPADISLDGYSAAFSNGGLQLSLSMSGKYEIPFMWGTARWKLDIDTVNVTASPAFDSNGYVAISDISVSRPGIHAKPDNAGAWTLGILYGPLVDIIVTIANDIVSGKIRDAIEAGVCQQIFKVPSSVQSVSGYTISIKAKDVSFDYNDAWPFVVRVDLGVTVDPPDIQLTAPVFTSPGKGEAYQPGTQISIAGTAQDTAGVMVSVSLDGTPLPDSPVPVQSGQWNHGSIVPAAGSHTLTAQQSFEGVQSPPATLSFSVYPLSAPYFTSPDKGEYLVGTQIAIAGSSVAANAAVSIYLDQVAMPNSPVTADQYGLWSNGLISPDVGQHTLMAYQTVGGGNSPQATWPLTIAPPAPQFSSPVNGAHFTAGTSIPVTGTGVDRTGAAVTISLDETALPDSPADVDAGQWTCGSITPPVGSHQLTAYQTLNGAQSAVATCSITIIDSTAPTVTSPTGDEVYSRWNPTLTAVGLAVPNATIKVSLDGSPFPHSPVTANANGNWSCQYGALLGVVDDGYHTVKVVQTIDDVDGKPVTVQIMVQFSLKD